MLCGEKNVHKEIDTFASIGIAGKGVPEKACAAIYMKTLKIMVIPKRNSQEIIVMLVTLMIMIRII